MLISLLSSRNIPKSKANNDISHYRVTSMRPATRVSLDEKLELYQFCSNISQNIVPAEEQMGEKWLMPHSTPNLQPSVKLVYKCGIKNVPSLPISLPFFSGIFVLSKFVANLLFFRPACGFSFSPRGKSQ